MSLIFSKCALTRRIAQRLKIWDKSPPPSEGQSANNQGHRMEFEKSDHENKTALFSQIDSEDNSGGRKALRRAMSHG